MTIMIIGTPVLTEEALTQNPLRVHLRTRQGEILRGDSRIDEHFSSG